MRKQYCKICNKEIIVEIGNPKFCSVECKNHNYNMGVDNFNKTIQKYLNNGYVLVDKRFLKESTVYVKKHKKYLVNDKGSVLSIFLKCQKNHSTPGVVKIIELKPSKTKDGYVQVGLSKPALVHRLIAFHFISGFKEGLEVDHIDDNRSNNRIENLQWLSKKNNLRKKSKLT